MLGTVVAFKEIDPDVSSGNLKMKGGEITWQ